jgi:hypothetical protein
VASGRLCADTGHRPCRGRDGGSRAHERDNTARAWPFTYVVVGDSLAAKCPWKWSFGLSPVAVANLAVGGADLHEITRQLDLAVRSQAVSLMPCELHSAS